MTREEKINRKAVGYGHVLRDIMIMHGAKRQASETISKAVQIAYLAGAAEADANPINILNHIDGEDERIIKGAINNLEQPKFGEDHYCSDEDIIKDYIVCPENQGKQKPEIEEINGEDYGIDGLWHAQSILEKTLGSVAGYQSDDGILEHKAAIAAVKKLYEQKPVKWSEEDEAHFNQAIYVCHQNGYTAVENWLQSLRHRKLWKPSGEQMKFLHKYAEQNNYDGKILTSLYNDLKKLKE